MEAIIPYFPPLKFVIPGLGVTVHGFAILFTLGLALATSTAMEKARRDGLNPKIILSCLTWMMVGCLLGGRTGHIIMYEPDWLQTRGWFYLFEFWDGQLGSVFGGAFTAVILIYIFLKLQDRRVTLENEKINRSRVQNDSLA